MERPENLRLQAGEAGYVPLECEVAGSKVAAIVVARAKSVKVFA